MEKNETGIPRVTLGSEAKSPEGSGVLRRDCRGNLRENAEGKEGNLGGVMPETRDGKDEKGRGVNNAENRESAPNCGMNGACGGGGPLDGALLSYVYAPSQKFCMLYSASEALKHGTLFEQLYKPKEVYGRE